MAISTTKILLSASGLVLGFTSVVALAETPPPSVDDLARFEHNAVLSLEKCDLEVMQETQNRWATLIAQARARAADLSGNETTRASGERWARAANEEELKRQDFASRFARQCGEEVHMTPETAPNYRDGSSE